MGMPRPRRRHRDLAGAAPLFAALGDPARLRIVSRLCERGPLPVVRLAEGAGISRQAISKHLDALAEVGLVHGERHGRERIWRLQPDRLDDARHHLDAIAARWDEGLSRLRAMVEE